MANVRVAKKSCTVNPLKMSQPIGAALAFMGIERSMPLLHGSQGCTAFGLVLFVRHFREMIPLQTTAMNEVTTILGGMENIEEAIVNIYSRTKPSIIGLCSTGLTEIKGDDVDGYLQLIRKKHPELEALEIIYVSTPDFKGAFQDGWAQAAAQMLAALVPERQETIKNQVNVLAGSHLSVADIDEIREIIESFGLSPIVVPDLSRALDGIVPEAFTPTTMGGTSVAEIKNMAASAHTLAIGESMWPAAELLAKKGLPVTVFPRLTGLGVNDDFIALLAELSGKPIPQKWRRERDRLVDAMLDGHFFFGKKRVAIGAEPDLLFALGSFLHEMGVEIAMAVTTTDTPILRHLPVQDVVIGDLEDLEHGSTKVDLLMTHSHGRQASERLGVPLFRVGLPQFDRIGAPHQLLVGYRGTRRLIYEIGNVFLANMPHPHPQDSHDHAHAPAQAY